MHTPAVNFRHNEGPRQPPFHGAQPTPINRTGLMHNVHGNLRKLYKPNIRVCATQRL
jgi:hypothetical protein